MCSSDLLRPRSSFPNTPPRGPARLGGSFLSSPPALLPPLVPAPSRPPLLPALSLLSRRSAAHRRGLRRSSRLSPSRRPPPLHGACFLTHIPGGQIHDAVLLHDHAAATVEEEPWIPNPSPWASGRRRRPRSHGSVGRSHGRATTNSTYGHGAPSPPGPSSLLH